MVVRGKQENAQHYFGLAIQSAIETKRPLELAQSLQAKGKDEGDEKNKEADKVDKSVGKRKQEEKPEGSCQRGRHPKIVSNYIMSSPLKVGHVGCLKTNSSKI